MLNQPSSDPPDPRGKPDADSGSGDLEAPPREGPDQEKPAAPHPDRDSPSTRQKEEEQQRRRRIERRTPE